ncbi:MAG: phospholipase [Planctomycetota bacterium]
MRRSVIRGIFAACLLVFLLGQVAPVEAQSSSAQQLRRSPDATRPGLDYWLYLPSDFSSDATEPIPLLLFLHGGGEGGSDPEKVKKHGPPKLIRQGRDFPCIVVSPQNPSTTQHWDDQQLIELVDHLIESFPVDTSRLYLTGLSRGCYGGWRLLVQNPDRFAAYVGICGGGLAPYAKRLAKVPVRLYHGADDPVIPVDESERMLEAHVAAGGDAKLVVYLETGHDAWTQTYENNAVFDWLFAQRRANSTARP